MRTIEERKKEIEILSAYWDKVIKEFESVKRRRDEKTLKEYSKGTLDIGKKEAFVNGYIECQKDFEKVTFKIARKMQRELKEVMENEKQG